ncbi:MAG: RagB/SusD family nutrient uptake outer membrane protein [Butyricimonas faecihominis]
MITNVGGSGDGTLKAYEDNEILIRLADIILLRAEVKVKTGDTQGAINDLNTIRARAGAPLYSASEGDLQEAIAKERDKNCFSKQVFVFMILSVTGLFGKS